MLPAVLYVALVFAVSSIPNLQAPGPGFLLKDKIAHFGEYLILGVVLFVGFGAATGRARFGAVVLLIVVGCSIGALDEVYQSFVPLRRMSASDWLADALGVTTGIAMATTIAVARLSRPVSPGEQGKP